MPSMPSRKQQEARPVACFCAVTKDGDLIPWLCDISRERLIGKLKEKRLTWRTRAVRIIPDDDATHMGSDRQTLTLQTARELHAEIERLRSRNSALEMAIENLRSRAASGDPDGGPSDHAPYCSREWWNGR